jgi:hypothetical protein
VATYDTLGKPLGDAIFALQKAMGDAFKRDHPSDGPLDPDQIAIDAEAFAKLLSEETSKLLIQYMVAYAGKVTTAPNTGAGQDYPIPTVNAGRRIGRIRRRVVEEWAGSDGLEESTRWRNRVPRLLGRPDDTNREQ